MRAWIIIFILIWSPGLSEKVYGGNCDVSATGILSKEELSKFLDRLKAAATANNVAAISKAVLYPLKLNERQERKIIKDGAELKKIFSSVFTKKILKAIKTQKFEDLFCRDQGAMIGEGEVWIDEKNGKIGIVVINL